jgi:hypothetical protein
MPFSWVIDVWMFLVLGMCSLFAALGVVPFSKNQSIQQRRRRKYGPWAAIAGLAMLFFAARIFLLHR